VAVLATFSALKVCNHNKMKLNIIKWTKKYFAQLNQLRDRNQLKRSH